MNEFSVQSVQRFKRFKASKQAYGVCGCFSVNTDPILILKRFINNINTLNSGQVLIS